MIVGVHHFGLTVRHAETSALWYTEVLGFRRVGEQVAPNGAYRKIFLIQDGLRTRLGLTEHRDGTRELFDESSVGLDHLAFAVQSRAELEGWVERLAAAGVEYTPPVPSRSLAGAAVVVFRDPDNIQLEFFHDPAWDPAWDPA